MTFLDDTPDEFDRHDMEADTEIEQRAEAGLIGARHYPCSVTRDWQPGDPACDIAGDPIDDDPGAYESSLEHLIAHEVNRTFDAALGESRR